MPDYPYASATILLQAGRKFEAANAINRALKVAPGFAPARALLGAP